MKRIIFLVPYPLDESPSQRFRFEQYFTILKNHDIRYSVYSFLNKQGWLILYVQGKFLRKLWCLVRGFILRIIHTFYTLQTDYVFIHREIAPIGPPVFEWIISKLFRKKIIYDFDDAIWMTDNVYESTLTKFLRWRSKVPNICRWSYQVSCGNEYLCSYAKSFTEHVVLNPTTIDTEVLHNPAHYSPQSQPSQVVRIGWTGSHSTLKYLKSIENVLRIVEEKFTNVKIIVIANHKPKFDLRSLEFVPWQKKTEGEDLHKFDIGVMPLPDDEWTKGKCGFKALQYMAMGIPTVASPVGVNTSIINHGKNGFLADTNEEWVRYLSELISDSQLRKNLGNAGRKKVIDHYSVLSNTSTFLSLFK